MNLLEMDEMGMVPVPIKNSGLVSKKVGFYEPVFKPWKLVAGWEIGIFI